MQWRFRPSAQDCSHNAPFALTYLRVTQTYRWTAEQPDCYVDPGWMNHAVAVFAKYYLRAYDTWSADNAAAVPEAWKIAFNAAKNGQVAGSGNLMLRHNAHINRDLAFAMATAGLVVRDSTSEKPDFDKVNQMLDDAPRGGPASRCSRRLRGPRCRARSAKPSPAPAAGSRPDRRRRR